MSALISGVMILFLLMSRQRKGLKIKLNPCVVLAPHQDVLFQRQTSNISIIVMYL